MSEGGNSKVFLLDQVPWFGTHTGYHQLVRSYPNSATMVRIRSNLRQRMIGKLYSTFQGWPPRDQAAAAAELKFWICLTARKKAIGHILFAEQHLLFLSKWREVPRRLLATIHLPKPQWTDEMRRQLKSLRSAVVLYRRDQEFFQEQMPGGRVRFCHHGVSTDFFRPRHEPVDPSAPKRILFGGFYLRNIKMLARVIERLGARHSSLQFDLLVPLHARANAAFAPLLANPKVFWHAGLADDQLLRLYQEAYLHLLPMNDSGANTAIVESLACGLPLVTTDVGGIRDYGGGSIFEVVPNDDDDAMISLAESYLADREKRDRISREERAFAMEFLDWETVAKRHSEVYAELTAAE